MNADPAPQDVGGWFASHTFHHRDFPVGALLARKDALRQRVTVVIPTLNEAATIAGIVRTIREELTGPGGLVDELHVIDSGSTDGTRELAAAAGAAVHLASAIRPDIISPGGKGENLWKAGIVSQADIFCFIDGDIQNFEAYFVSGLLGPLLMDPSLLFAKAFYERPLAPGGVAPDPGGGRVTEILIRPMFSLFFPELCGIIQPLSGEYAMRRSLHQTLAFPSGYGVEAAHLVDIARMHGIGVMAQVDLEHRLHRVRGTPELGYMACRILQSLWPRLPARAHAGAPADTRYHGIAWDGSAYQRQAQALADIELPPQMKEFGPPA